MKKWTKVTAGILAAGTLLVTGCGLQDASKNTAVNNTPSPNDVQANLYFADGNGYVVPIVSTLTKADQVAGQALDLLTQGGAGEQMLAGTGLYTVIPKGTQHSLNIKDGLATVDLSKEVLQYKTAKEEQDIVQSIVWSLTEFPTVKQVQFEIGGQILAALPQGTPIGSPISRANGINLQIAPTTNPTDSSHVTVYLFDATSAGKTYLVPVTRVVPRMDAGDSTGLLKAAIGQMAGSGGYAGLKESVAAGDVLNSAKVVNNAVQIDLKNAVFPNGATPSTQADVLKSVWLSVAANLNVKNVQITVDGKPVSVFSSAIDWSKPVTDLQYINQPANKSI
ncbi:MAG: hypothetical protein JWN30_663 [Bacilli bacterium]|nr:hypothetical protein [Bacilli bacterium]